MTKSREYMPGDEVELYFSYPESGKEKAATVVSLPHDERIKVKFGNGNVLEIPVSDIANRRFQ